MKKRLIALSLALLMMLGAETFPVSAKNDKDHKGNGYHDVELTVGMPESKSEKAKKMKKEKEAILDAESEALPSAYSSVTEGRVTSAKNQNPDGTCWAFSASAACETGLNASTGENTELSVIQLVNFFYNQKFDPLGNAVGDKTVNMDDTKLDQGGNHAFTMWGLAGWTNGAPDSVLPYSTANRNAANASSISAEYAYGYDIAHLQNAYIIPYGTGSSELENIKEAIIENGSVACSFYYDGAYYNSSTGAYCCGVSSSNHAVTIVGWNDAYPASNFRSGPAANGAWLVKNSWGNNWGTDGDSNPANRGAEGYFWLSYYDSSIRATGEVYAFDFQTTDAYQYNYQYDGSCGIRTTTVNSGDRVAAIYEVGGLTSDAESLKAVGIGVYSTDMQGTVTVYRNPDSGKPISGEKIAEASFETSYAGFYTVEFSEAPILNAGETFSVVVSFTTGGMIFVDYSYTNGTWIKFVANTDGDKTYIVNSYGTVKNLASSGQTARLKAYTVDCELPGNYYQITYDSNGGSNAPAAQRKYEGTDKALSTQLPTREGYKFLGWASDANAEAAEYQPGEFYSADQDLHLYALWELLPVEKRINVSVNVKSVSSGKGKKKTTTYTAAISASAVETAVQTVEYSRDAGQTWTLGSSFTSSANPTDLMIRVTVTDGTKCIYHYDSGKVSFIEKYEIVVADSLVISDSALSMQTGDSATVIVYPNPVDADCDFAVSGVSDVVSVRADGSSFTVEALKAGNVKLIFTDRNSGLAAECTVTVEEKPAPEKDVTVKVSFTQKTTGNNKKQTTVYTAKIEPQVSGTSAAKVEYKTDKKWIVGTSFESKNTQPNSFYIRITDAEGDQYNFRYYYGEIIDLDS